MANLAHNMRRDREIVPARMPDLKIDALRLRLRFAPAMPDTLRADDLGVAAPRVARGGTPVRLRFAPATLDTLRPDDLSVAAPRVARQGEAWWGKKIQD
jgi:hypothetical protein